MEFLVYLSPIGNEIVSKLIKAKFLFRENIGLCSNRDIYGYTEDTKKFVVCTNNIKRKNVNVYDAIAETVFHEAVHAAQICMGYRPLNISKNQIKLEDYKEKNLYNSLKVTNNLKNNLVFNMEREAYWLEDKPEIVNYYVSKSCLRW